MPVGEDERQIVDRSSGQKKTIFTELVLVVSNFHFNKRAQDIPQEVVCTPLDCFVSLKYSSTKFKPTAVTAAGAATAGSTPTDPGIQDVSVGVGSRYYFDSNYVFFNYQSFVTLATDGYMIEQFWPAAKSLFEKITGLPLETGDLLQIFLNDNEDDDDDNKVGERPKPAKKSKQAGSKKRPTKAVVSSDDDDDDDYANVEEVDDDNDDVSDDVDDDDDEEDDEETDQEDPLGPGQKRRRPQSLAAPARSARGKKGKVAVAAVAVAGEKQKKPRGGKKSKK